MQTTAEHAIPASALMLDTATAQAAIKKLRESAPLTKLSATQNVPAKLVTRVLQRAAIMAANMPARHGTGPKLIGTQTPAPAHTGSFILSSGEPDNLRDGFAVSDLQAIDAPRLIASGSTRAIVLGSGTFYFPVCSVGRPS